MACFVGRRREMALMQAAQLAAVRRFILILDEFPYVAEAAQARAKEHRVQLASLEQLDRELRAAGGY